MSERRVFRLVHRIARANAVEHVARVPDGYIVTVAPPTRSSSANARMWALLTVAADNVVWHGRKLDASAWKHVFSAALKKQDVVPGLDGTGFVVLGLSTSQMSVGEMNDMQTLIEAFLTERGVAYFEPDSKPVVRQPALKEQA